MALTKKEILIIQFPIFIQLYMQQPLILYQIETVPVPIIDKKISPLLHTPTDRQALHSPKF